MVDCFQVIALTKMHAIEDSKPDTTTEKRRPFN